MECQRKPSCIAFSSLVTFCWINETASHTVIFSVSNLEKKSAGAKARACGGCNYMGILRFYKISGKEMPIEYAGTLSCRGPPL